MTVGSHRNTGESKSFISDTPDPVDTPDVDPETAHVDPETVLRS